MVVLLPQTEKANNFHINLEILGMAHPIYYEAKQLLLLKTTGENGVNISVAQFDDEKKGTNLILILSKPLAVDKMFI